jgi:hypothetical protein
MHILINLTLASLIALSGPVLALLSAQPGDGPLMVLAWPWTDPVGLVSRAGGWIVGPDVTTIAVFAWSDAPEFAARLHEAGALLVRDGRLLAQICGVSPI